MTIKSQAVMAPWQKDSVADRVERVMLEELKKNQTYAEAAAAVREETRRMLDEV